MAEPFLVVDLPDEAATEALAEDVAACLAKGDAVALWGDLGAGKTSFARALIRALAGDLTLEVPSPTFTLVQTYQLPRVAVAHVDLYRVHDPAEIEETGLFDALSDGAVLIEWPERAGNSLPQQRLDVALEIARTGRRASLAGNPDWQRRIADSRAIRAFLQAHRIEAHRFANDAAERIVGEEQRGLLVRVEPGSESKLRPRLIAEQALRDVGFSTPNVLAIDERRGLAVVEDLAGEPMIGEGGPIRARAFIAIEALAELHCERRPVELQYAESAYPVPGLASDAFAEDVVLFTGHYVPHATGHTLPDKERREFDRLWWKAFELVVEGEWNWVVRPAGWMDLTWLPDREGLQRIGFTGVRELLIGSTAYNVAALAQDPAVTVPEELETELLRHYSALRQAANPRFNADAFAAAYAIVGAVQASRALGVAAQAAKGGDNEAEATIGRLLTYLHRDLAHPVLSPLAAWYERHLATKP